MSDFSKKPSETDSGLSIDEDVRQRLGETRYQLIMLWIDDVTRAFDGALQPHITPESRVLDAGCSRGDPDMPSLLRARLLVGSDADMAGLLANRLTPHRICNRLDALPFRQDVFDVVVLKFVVEHLADPVRVLRELAGVTAPGGVVAVLTPNRFSLFALVSSVLPHRLKQVFKRRLFGGHEEDTFPTHYAANTRRALCRAMRESGFTPVHVAPLHGMWAFFIFFAPLARMVRVLERLALRVPGLRWNSTYIVGLFVKSHQKRK